MAISLPLLAASAVSLTLAFPIFARPAHALGTPVDTAWTSRGLVVSGEAHAQQGAALAAAPAGGLFVAWEDARAHPDTTDLYVQRLNADGTVASGWPAAGAPCSMAPGSQSVPQIAGDGSGGVFAVWEDGRSGTTQRLYAQHLSPLGVPVAGWPAHGLPVCIKAGTQRSARVVADGSGGIFIVWEDYRTPQSRIVAQHLLGDGSFAPGWADTGRVVAPSVGGQVSPSAVADGAGGLYVTWSDGRGGAPTLIDIYAQRLRGDASTAPGWPESGVAVCTETGAQDRPGVVADGTGSAYVAWTDPRSGTYNIYAQRLTGAGTLSPGWPENGTSVSSAGPGHFDPVLTSDGFGRAIIAWVDARGGPGNSDIYVQRLNSDGTPTWANDGLGICTAPGDQLFARIVPDGAGGALIAWQDGRFAPETRLFAQRVTDTGLVFPGWPGDGRLVADTNLVVEPAAMIAGGDGGAYFAWSGVALPEGPGAPDLFAARVRGNSVVPALASLVSAEVGASGVALRWWVRSSATRVGIERRAEGGSWELRAEVPIAGSLVEWTDREVAPGARYGYRLTSPEGIAGEAWVTVPARRLALSNRGPQPAAERATFALSLAGGGPAVLEVFDVGGRRRWSREFAPSDGALDAVIGTAGLEPGVYRVRLRQGAARVTAKLLVAR
jgi:hypothetical protein